MWSMDSRTSALFWSKDCRICCFRALRGEDLLTTIRMGFGLLGGTGGGGGPSNSHWKVEGSRTGDRQLALDEGFLGLLWRLLAWRLGGGGRIAARGPRSRANVGFPANTFYQ